MADPQVAQAFHDGRALVVPLVVGGLLGLFFFGGLWWTVQRLPTARHPAPFSLASMVVRMAVVLAGFYWLMDGDWVRLLACAVGFLAARTAVIHRYRPTRDEPVTGRN